MRLRANYSISHPIEYGMTKDDLYHPFLSDFLKQLECTCTEEQIIEAIALNHGTATIGSKFTFKKFIVKYSTKPYQTILFKESIDSQFVENKAKISRMKI